MDWFEIVFRIFIPALLGALAVGIGISLIPPEATH